MVDNDETPQTTGRFATERNLNVPVASPGEFKPLQLGKKLSIWPPVLLAPMAGVTNPPFRSLCRDSGAPLCVSEMITARAWLRGNKLTHLLASSAEDERPRSFQIYSSDPDEVREFIKRLAPGVDHIDLNFGCPVPKVTRVGGGSAIPLKPRLLARILKEAVGAAGEVPVTIKVRKGISDDLLTWRDSGRVASEEGAAAICLHGRTAAQLYSGEADWDSITQLVEASSIPVLGNGDIWECWDALRMMRETGCMGVVIGRACLGRPWLFRELASIFDGDDPGPPPTIKEIIPIIVDHATRLMDFFGPDLGMRQMRKWGVWYTKGFHGSSAVRESIVRVSNLEDLKTALEKLNPEESFPLLALRTNRAKGSRKQRVVLPERYLDNLEDDTPPKGPISVAEMAAWDKALSGG